MSENPGPETLSTSGEPPAAPEPERFVRARLADARRASHVGGRQAARAGTQGLLQHAEASGWRLIVEQIVASELRASITSAWNHGWQPADLLRIVAHRLSAAHVPVTADAIAAELQRYALWTIDPLWSAQLTEAGARVWWPADRSHLTARCQRPGARWQQVLSRAVDVLCLIDILPAIQHLGTVPGACRPPSASGRQAGPNVDERVLSRIRALLAKAEATTSPAEAEAFTVGAQERMARHSIDLAMLSASTPDATARPGARRIGIDAPYEPSKASLVDAVAAANRCRAVWTRQLGFSTVIGFETDLHIVETLFTSLLVQAITSMTRAEGERASRTPARARSFRQSFLSAYAYRIRDRLSEVVQAEMAAATQTHAREHLLPVLASRGEAVDNALQDMFPALSTSRAPSVTDVQAWNSGLAAADQASLSPGAGIRP